MRSVSTAPVTSSNPGVRWMRQNKGFGRLFRIRMVKYGEAGFGVIRFLKTVKVIKTMNIDNNKKTN